MDSNDDILFLVADLLCGFLVRCFQKINNELELSDIEKDVMRHLFVLHDEMHTWDYVFPEILVVKYLKAIGLSVKEPPQWTIV